MVKSKEKQKERQTNPSMPEMEDILSCSTFDYDSEIHSELERHMLVLPPPKINSDQAAEVIEGGQDICESLYSCVSCGLNFEDQNECVTHMLIHNEPDIIHCC